MIRHRIVLALAALFLLSGHNGGCHEDDGEPLPSPVNAVASVLEAPDGTTEARLALWSRSVVPAAWIEGADEVVLTSAAGADAMTEDAAGLWRANATYLPGESYRFAFHIDGATAKRFHVYDGDFAIAMHAPRDRPAIAVDGRRVSWSPAGMRAFVRVYDADGALTYASFDPERLDFEGGDEGIAQGAIDVADGAFAGPGAHTVWVCAVEILQRDDAPSAAPQHALDSDTVAGKLGWLSGAVVGRCSARDV